VKPAVAAIMFTFSTKVSVAPANFLSLIDNAKADTPTGCLQVNTTRASPATSLTMASKM